MTNGDFKNVNLKDSKLDRLSLDGCVVPENFFEKSEIGSITLGSIELKDGVIEKLKKAQNIKSILLIGERKLNAETILKDYPDFDSLSRTEKLNIIQNPYYILQQSVDLSALQKIDGLEELELHSIELTQNNVDSISDIKSLKSLGIGETNLSDGICLKPIPALKELKISGNIQSLNIISKMMSVSDLSICQEGKDKIDTSVLLNFVNLERLSLSNLQGVEENIPDANKIKRIALRNCGIEDAKKSIFDKYLQLEQVNLDENPLTNTSAEDMKKAKVDKNITLSFKNSSLYEKLNLQILDVSSEEMEKKLKTFLSIYSLGNISQYDLLTSSSWKQTIDDTELLNEIARLGIDDIALKKIKNVEVDSWEKLGEEAKKALKSGPDRNLEIKSLNGLTAEQLKELEKNIKIKVKNDSKGEYTTDELVAILEVMEQIKAQIPENASEYEKFRTVYNIIGMSANYDHSGCIGDEEYIPGAERLTRSLKGVLLEGRAVCAGYALALEKCLKYVGVDAKQVSGYAFGKPENAHAWNQVCIDGKWYNADLTWDSKRIQREMPLMYCLLGDKKFSQDHTASTVGFGEEQLHKCDDDYILNEVGVAYDKPTRTSFGKGVPTLFGTNDYKEVAQETIIEPSAIESLKNEISKQQEQQIMQEENAK